MFSFPRNLWTSFVGPVHEPVHESPYDPSGKDVLHVKGLLHNISTLPLELIDQIIDLAEYWPHTTTTTPFAIRVAKGPNENKFVVCSINILVRTSQLINHSCGLYPSVLALPLEPTSRRFQRIKARINPQTRIPIKIQARFNRIYRSVSSTRQNQLSALEGSIPVGKLSLPSNPMIKAGEVTRDIRVLTMDRLRGLTLAWKGCRLSTKVHLFTA